MTENREHDKLFADLDALSEEQIQVGLAAGVWSEPVRPLVQHYLYDLKLKRVEAAAEQLDDVREAARLAVEEAVKSRTRATGCTYHRGWGNAGGDVSGVSRFPRSAEVRVRASLVG
jgi:hypothetical protein